jgi:hypothetical protein
MVHLDLLLVALPRYIILYVKVHNNVYMKYVPDNKLVLQKPKINE